MAEAGGPSFAIIGCGNAGRYIHAPLIAGTPGICLAGVFSRDVQRRSEAAAALGCCTWPDFDAVLADPGIDVVVLATPTAEHLGQALAALAAGKHVVVDKPVCLDLAGLEALAAAETAAKRTVVAFHNRRWDGDFRTVRRLCAAGVLGRLQAVELAWGAFGLPRGWRATRAGGGGRVYDLGMHMADQLCQLMPSSPQTVYARLHPPLPGQEVERHAHIVIGFADGATGVIETGYISSLPKPRFRILGTSACFEKSGLDPQEAALRAGDVDAAQEDPDHYGWLSDGTTRTRVPTVPGRWRGLYEELREHLCAGGANPVSLASVRPAVALIEAAFRSADSGSVERVAG